MIDKIDSVVNAIGGFLYQPYIVPLFLIVAGLYFTIRTGLIQFRLFGESIHVVAEKPKEKGSISSFGALMVSTASRVGTGNIVGVSTAICLGGFGAVFWMWISALLGMCTKFAEVTLAGFYHEKNANGELVGGPMYYIKNGLSKKWHFLAYLFAAFGVLTVFGTGNATQVNTITTAVNSALMNYHVISKDAVPTSNLIQGIIIAALVALILLGGVKRIAQVTEKLVPFMALFYIVLAIGVILLNLNRIPSVFVSILEGAFRPSAVTGGIVGSMLMSVKKGVSRGIFSNEAGLGTGSIAHACADTKKPVKQGMFGIFEVGTDTIVICTLTALVILCSGTSITYGQAAGAELTISGFTLTYGNWVSLLTAFAMCCFAFSTILGWGLYGARCIEFLFSERITKYFMAAYALVAILGATANLGLMWSIAETFNGLMAIPNLIALFLLSGKVVELTKEYFCGEGKTR